MLFSPNQFASLPWLCFVNDVWVPDAQGLLYREEGFPRATPVYLAVLGREEHRECSSTLLLLYRHPVGNLLDRSSG